jgi:hypothetical protein
VTAEHVLPSWLTKIPLKPIDLTEHRKGRPPSTRREPALYTEKVRRVCQERCNGGWMNRIEDAAKPILTRLIQNQRALLSPQAQTVIARWTGKTALMACYLNPEIPVPADYPPLFYNRKEPPPITVIWIATYDLSGLRAESYRRSRLRVPWSDRPQLWGPAGAVAPHNVNGYRITINVWHFAFTVMVFRPPPGWSDRPISLQIELDRQIPGAIPIWPRIRSESVRWPITPMVDDIGLSSLANARPVVRPQSPG